VAVGLPDVLAPEVVLEQAEPRRRGVHHVLVALDGVVVVEGEAGVQRVAERQQRDGG